MNRILLGVAMLFLLSGCSVSNETTEAIALQALGSGGQVLFSEHVPSLIYKNVHTSHTFVGKMSDESLVYIRIEGEKIVKREVIPKSP